jgi:hypothetical protein
MEIVARRKFESNFLFQNSFELIFLCPLSGPPQAPEGYGVNSPRLAFLVIVIISILFSITKKLLLDRPL